MNITTINAGSTVFAGGSAVNVRRDKDGKRAAGRFDTFKMSGIASEKTDNVQKAPDEEKAALIRGLSLANEEERALAAIDSYHALRREFVGMADALEKEIGYFSELKSELKFCEEAKENGCRAAAGGKYSFGSITEGQRLEEDFLDRKIAQLHKGIELMVKRWDRNAGNDSADPDAKKLSSAVVSGEEGRLKQHAEIFNTVTGGGSLGVGNYEESGCFDRYIDGVTEDNFVSKLSERISQYNSYSDDLYKTLNNYLEKNKTAEAVFKKYPAILEMRRQFADAYKKIQEMAWDINKNLGINDFLTGLNKDEDR